MESEPAEHWNGRVQAPCFQTSCPSLLTAYASLPSPPPTYVCFRCGQKGHYIQFCPTNADPTFDKPKVKKSTGIPRSFLKPVEGDQLDGNVLVTADGSLVVAVSNDQEWTKLSTSVQAIDSSEIPKEIQCSICSKLMVEPVCCPSCSIAFCEECISKTGVEKLKCPSCFAEFAPEQLNPSEELRVKIDCFLAERNKPKAAPSQPFLPPLGMPPFFAFPPPPLPFIPARPPVVDTKREPSRRRDSRSRSRSPTERKSRRSPSRSRSPPRRSYRR